VGISPKPDWILGFKNPILIWVSDIQFQLYTSWSSVKEGKDNTHGVAAGLGWVVHLKLPLVHLI